MTPDPMAIPPSGEDKGVAGYLPGPGGTTDTGQQDDVSEYLRILIRRRHTVLLTCMLVLVAAVAYVLTTPRIYQATAKVQILRPQSSVLDASRRPDPMTPGEAEQALKTQAEVLTSALLAQETAQHLRQEHGLAIQPSEVLGSVRVDPEGSDLIVIRAQNRDPARAALIASAVLDTYIEHSRDEARESATSLRKFLEAQIPRLVEDVQRAESSVASFKLAHQLQGDDPAAEAQQARDLSDYIAAAERAQADVDAARAELDGLHTRMQSLRPTRMAKRVIADPEFAGFTEEIARTEVDLEKARQRYEDSHPRVVAIQEKLKGLQELMRQRYGNRQAPYKLEDVEEPDPEYEVVSARIKDQEGKVQSLVARAQTLEQSAARKKASLPANSGAQVELGRLVRAKDVAEKTYLTMLERMQQARIDEAAQQGLARKVDIAGIPHSPIRPNVPLTLVLALAMGLFAGASLAVLQERSDTSIHDPDEMMRSTGIAVLGSIPEVRSRHHAVLPPERAVAEATRLLYANLKFTSSDRAIRTLVLTSVAPGEGKTFVSLSLAAVAAQANRRVILIDTDLRRPTIHRLLKWKSAPGLVEVLAGEVTLQDALHDTEVPNLRILTCGRHVSNPTVLLDSAPMAQLIEQLQQEADLVLFDTPPTLAIADTLVLVAHADATLLVTEQGGVPAKALWQVRRMIEQAHGTILGAVINRVRPGLADYYSHYYRYYTNSPYGEEEDREEFPALLPGTSNTDKPE